METKFERFQNQLPLIFGTHEVIFKEVDDVSCCVRSARTAMFCGCEIVQLVELAQSLQLSFYVRSVFLDDGRGAVDFVIY